MKVDMKVVISTLVKYNSLGTFFTNFYIKQKITRPDRSSVNYLLSYVEPYRLVLTEISWSSLHVKEFSILLHIHTELTRLHYDR